MLPYILAATAINSLVGLVGAFSLYVREDALNRLMGPLVAFAAGAMLGGALLHILPEAMDALTYAPELAAFGFLGFFLLERVLHWHHCNEDSHPVNYLVIFGDGLHNFLDGLVIASAFLADVRLGAITTLLILLHEVPQELANFAILLSHGFDRWKALRWTFLSQTTSLLGGLAGWLYFPQAAVPAALAFAGGGFLYIAASDLVPEIGGHGAGGLIPFISGLAVMEILRLLG